MYIVYAYKTCSFLKLAFRNKVVFFRDHQHSCGLNCCCWDLSLNLSGPLAAPSDEPNRNSEASSRLPSVFLFRYSRSGTTAAPSDGPYRNSVASSLLPSVFLFLNSPLSYSCRTRWPPPSWRLTKNKKSSSLVNLVII